MPRKYLPVPVSREDKIRRRSAARVGALAIERIQEQGLVKSADYRFWPGITLDRALQPGPFWVDDLEGITFPEWLHGKDSSFDPTRHTIGSWADQHTQDEVLEMLASYVVAMGGNRVPSVQAPLAGVQPAQATAIA